jgi:Cu/Ag efflux pump CusA
MTTTIIIAIVIVILLALFSIPYIKSYRVRKEQREEKERIIESKYQIEKRKIKVYGEQINKETREKHK